MEGEPRTGRMPHIVYGDALAALDAELAAQIERLQEKRRVIAELRERSLDPDVPPRVRPPPCAPS